MVKRRKHSDRRRKARPAGRKTGGPQTASVEWVGGWRTMPAYVGGDEPFRPEVALWLELPSGLIVNATVVDPSDEPTPLGDTLLEAMRSPVTGPARRPARVRVDRPQLAAEVRRVLPDAEVTVAPTPELDALIEDMTANMAGGDDASASYFEGGRIPEPQVERLFRGAELLYRLAPWKVVDDDLALRVDIPRLGVEGACVSIFGTLGESLGFILLPSLLAFDAFRDAADRRFADGPIDVGTSFMALGFDPASDLPRQMRKEALENGWPIAAPEAYPTVVHRDRDGDPSASDSRDYEIMAACATALASFFFRHRPAYARGDLFEVSESFFDDTDLEVRITAPYDAIPPPRQSAPRKSDGVGRNEPCPCGSGKKYKKCCLPGDKATQQQASGPASEHEVDRRLVEHMADFAARRFGSRWERAFEVFDEIDPTHPLAPTWAVYGHEVDGKPVVEWFLEEHGGRLSRPERNWLESQRAAWLSVWEVTSVAPGKTLTLEDLLSGETRTVVERLASRVLALRDVVLARIVDHDGRSLLGGIHPRLLPPLAAAEAVDAIRKRLRRKTAVPVDRLRSAKSGRAIIASWEEAVLDEDIRRRMPPRLQNTDGDELLLTTDHFDITGDVAVVAERLRELAGVQAYDDDRLFMFHEPGNAAVSAWDNTIVGRVLLSDETLRAEGNSVRRADALRSRLEEACGDHLRHRAREHADPMAGAVDGPGEDWPAELPDEQADALLREYKTRHYADWPDEPVPALDGKTPRQAARTKAGRARVDVLLKEYENHEARMPPGQRFDFTPLRETLGLS